MDILVMLNRKDGQYKVNKPLINAYLKDLTKSETFNVDNFDDFIKAFKHCKSVGNFSILVQLACNSYLLYDNAKDIIKDREYSKRLITCITQCTNKVFNDINHLALFVNHNNAYFFAYQDISNVELYSLVAKMLIKICPDLLYKSPRLSTRDNKRIKVGFISDYLTSFHSVTRDRLGIVKHLFIDSDFEVKVMTRKPQTDYFYNEVVFKDIDTANLLVELDNNDITVMRKQIEDQRFDIIIYPEIGMCPVNRYIAFSRLAPIQITTWGHSDTSGLPHIDYYISSKYFNTPEDQSYYSEKLLLFDSLGTYYYDISRYLEYVNSTPTNIRESIIEKTGVANPNIYGCLQIFFKLHPIFVRMVNLILDIDKNAVIMLLSTKPDNPEYSYINDYIDKQFKHKDRLYVVETAPYIEYTNYIRSCDVILDYYPFGGFNSTIESFSLGKIVITRPGKRISGKFTQGLYNKMGITEFICHSEHEYAHKAIEYASNPNKRSIYQNLIRENLSKVFEDIDSVTEWKTTLKRLYQAK